MSRKRKMAVWFVMGLCSVWGVEAFAFDVVPGVIGNDQYIKGWVGLGDPNGGLIGPYGTWNDQVPTNIWAVGVRGQLDVSNVARTAIGTVFGVPEIWWKALDTVGARVYVGDEVGACHLIGGSEAQTTPFIGARLFVLTAEVGYDIFENGRIETADGVLAKSGMTWFVGVSRDFKF
jgi:hypothetical protein